MSHRARGWLPDPEGVISTSAVGDPAPVLPSSDQSAFRGPRLSQGQLSSCVAHAIARAIRICNAIASRTAPTAPIPDASRRFIYWAGRRAPYVGLDPTTLPPLEDNGCVPSLAIHAVAALGYPLESECPYDLATAPAWVNQAPPVSAFRHAYDQRGLVFAKVYGDRVDTVKAAMAAGWACIFGIHIDKPFETLAPGGVIESISSAIIGGHMLSVLNPDAGGTVKVDNWWEGWGDVDGTGRITHDIFNSENVADVTLIKSVPIYSEIRAS